MKAGVLILVAVCAVTLYFVLNFYTSITASKKLIEKTVPFDKRTTDSRVALLVLGDSTGVGVGADTPEESVAGRVAAAIGATYTENRAVVGAQVEDVAAQAADAALPEYRVILIQIGANDMVRFHSARDAATTLTKTLKALPSAERIVVISAGDLGTARIFPFPLRLIYSRVTHTYHTAFSTAVPEAGATYVDLSKGPGAERFNTEPARYFAADSFHLSSDGYELWFDAIRPSLPQ